MLITVRYFLSFVMIVYSVVKFAGIQFALPEGVTNMPLKDIDGVTLTFAFLGYSKWFAIFLGAAELLPAILLWFSRTYLAGGILLFPIIVFVFLVNINYGFFPHMVLWTGALLTLDGILLFSQRKKLVQIFRLILTY